MADYTYVDMPDKTIEGIKREVHEGLAKAAAFFQQTYGFPFEAFKEELSKLDNLGRVAFYMNFRNMHPNVFK